MNYKKIAIVILAIVAILAIGIGSYYLYQNNKWITLSALDNSYQVKVPKHIQAKVKEVTNETDKLDFYSVKNEMTFTSSMYPKTENMNLVEFIENEKTHLSEVRENIRELSDTEDLTISNNKAYRYSYLYFDNAYQKDFFAEIVWIETETNIYVLDLEVIVDNKDKFISIFHKIENSFVENTQV